MFRAALLSLRVLCPIAASSLGNDAAFHNQGRWGDYTAVTPSGVFSDGATPNPFPKMWWLAGMFARSDGILGTQIDQNGFTCITQRSRLLLA